MVYLRKIRYLVGILFYLFVIFFLLDISLCIINSVSEVFRENVL